MNYKQFLKSKVLGISMIGVSTTVIGLTGGGHHAHAAEVNHDTQPVNNDENKVVIQYQDEEGNTNTKEIATQQVANQKEQTQSSEDTAQPVTTDQGQTKNNTNQNINDQTNNEGENAHVSTQNEQTTNETPSNDVHTHVQQEQTQQQQPNENVKQSHDTQVQNTEYNRKQNNEAQVQVKNDNTTQQQQQNNVSNTQQKQAPSEEITTQDGNAQRTQPKETKVHTIEGLGQVQQPTEKITSDSHEVKADETLDNIAERSGVSVDNIKKWNHLKDGDVSPKQKLYLINPKKNNRVTTPIHTPTHAVKSGETLYNIATRSGVSVSDLRKWNHISDNNEVAVGQELKVQAPKTMQNTSQIKDDIYRTKAGDTVESIAERSGVSVADLKKWNRISSNKIDNGQILRVKPISDNDIKPDPIKRDVYVVTSNDTLESISKRSGVSVANIKKWNNLKNGNIVVGRALKLTAPTPTKHETYPKPSGRDTFGSMKQLEDVHKDKEGKTWSKEWRYSDNNNSIIFAPHGGGIEMGTTEVARAIAERGGHDYYSFNGLKKSNNHELHVTSTHYDEPTLTNELKKKNVAVSIHGAGGSEPVVYVGGRDKKLMDNAVVELRKQGFNAQYAPAHLAGSGQNNIVNRTKSGQGLQLELSTGMRKAMFTNNDNTKAHRQNEANWSYNMTKFSNAVNSAIDKTYGY